MLFGILKFKKRAEHGAQPTPLSPKEPSTATQTGNDYIPEDPAASADVKVNIGCGWDVRPGWLNVDMHEVHKPDIVADATNLDGIADGYANHALAQDILEHIHRARCMTALREWNRILKLGGTLEIRVPDIMSIIDLMREPGRNNLQQHKTFIQCIYGTQSYDGDFHLNGFTEITLRADLKQAGFEVEYLGHVDHWLFRVIARKKSNVSNDELLLIRENSEFLRHAYLRYLGREPDESGFAEFSARLNAGTPREIIMEILSHGETH